MAAESTATDARNGYSPVTKTYQSLRPSILLPPLSQPLSISSYALSLLPTPPPTTPFLIDSTTNQLLTYPTFLSQLNSLSFSLKPLLSQNDVAFILSPPSIHIPLLYFSLLSLGVTISPANPLSSQSELSHQIKLSKPAVIFATSQTSRKLTINSNTNSPILILIDSDEFQSMLVKNVNDNASLSNVVVNQTDTAAILYSSGTTGKVKGVAITHRNLIAVIAGMYHNKVVKTAEEEEEEKKGDAVSLFTLPMFHVFGFFMLIRALSMGDTVVLMDKFDFVRMLEAVEKYRVTYIPVSPPLIVAMVKSDLVSKYDLSSLQVVGSGGAPLGKEVALRFREKFPNVEIFQGFGLTETSGAATRTIGPEEAQRYGSAGRLNENFEAKIVDPETGDAVPPGQRGELWLRGPAIMKGYAGDDAATSSTLDSEGWLKTGDLCYFDEDGFLYVVARLKELIKYKAYQVPPAELEHILQSIPGIADAAVIPYPDEEAGEIPMAYVVRKPDSTISATEIMDLIAKQVAPYKKIRRVSFINSIPKSPAGKILRRELVNHAIRSSPSKL